MSEFRISLISEKRIDDVAFMLAPEIVSTVKKGLPATVLAVIEDDTAIGALSGVVDTDVFEIVSIYVTPGRRRKGAGTALMKKLFELADAEDLIVRAEYTPVDEEGRTIEPFLIDLDFTKEKIIFPVYSSEILENIELDSRSLPGSMAEIMSFAEAPEEMLNKALNLRREEDGMLGDIDSFIGLMDRKISFLAVEKEWIKACILAERVSEGMIELTPIWSMEPDMRNMKLMMSFVLDELRASCPPDTSIIIPSLNDETLQLVEEICSSSALITLGFEKRSFADI